MPESHRADDRATPDPRFKRLIRCKKCHAVTHYAMRDEGPPIAVLFPKCRCGQVSDGE